MSKTFSIKTLGCKLNQYESSQMAGQFLSNGWKALPFGEKVDLVIINTCTVTDRSEKKCRNYIRQGARFSKTGKAIVTGCLADRDSSTLEKMTDVLKTFRNDEKINIFAGVSHLLNDIPDNSNNDTAGEEGIDEKVHDYHLPFFQTRGFLKIQDGCDGKCSYCIVPSVRGKPASREMQEVLDHAKKYIDAG